MESYEAFLESKVNHEFNFTMQHDVIFTKTSTFAVSNYSPSRQCAGIELMFNGGIGEFVITPLTKDHQPAACRIGLPVEDIDALIEGLQKLKADHVAKFGPTYGIDCGGPRVLLGAV